MSGFEEVFEVSLEARLVKADSIGGDASVAYVEAVVVNDLAVVLSAEDSVHLVDALNFFLANTFLAVILS